MIFLVPMHSVGVRFRALSVHFYDRAHLLSASADSRKGWGEFSGRNGEGQIKRNASGFDAETPDRNIPGQALQNNAPRDRDDRALLE
ncbi:MAG TPA: hypothetical protein VKS81_07955, partial [Bacteroidota bacterium]|nr:hypothetical protein [Bacteroidota bacterium]